jgi:hypothetical protein
MYPPRHLSCYQLQSEQIEVEGMYMLEVKGMDMVEEQDHPTNHRLGEKGMNMAGSNMVEVDGMDTVEDHFHPMNHGPEVEDLDMVEEHFHLINHGLEVEGMDTVDIGTGKDRAAELEVVERELESVVLARYWTSDGATRHQRTHREWEELAKPGC